MNWKSSVVLAGALTAASCSSPDQPASPERLDVQTHVLKSLELAVDGWTVALDHRVAGCQNVLLAVEEEVGRYALGEVLNTPDDDDGLTVFTVVDSQSGEVPEYGHIECVDSKMLTLEGFTN